MKKDDYEGDMSSFLGGCAVFGVVVVVVTILLVVMA